MNKKITIGYDIEFSEIHKGKVKPLAKSGYIPFYKRFLGRIVNIMLPKPTKCFWLLKEEDLKEIKKLVDKIKIPEAMYSKAIEDKIKDSMREIIKNSNDFLLDDLIEVINGIEQYYKETELTEKIKEIYSI